MHKENNPNLKNHRFVFDDFSFDKFSDQKILKHLKPSNSFTTSLDVKLLNIAQNQASFFVENSLNQGAIVSIVKGAKQLLLNCDCGFNHSDNYLCEYQAEALTTLKKREEYGVFLILS